MMSLVGDGIENMPKKTINTCALSISYNISYISYNKSVQRKKFWRTYANRSREHNPDLSIMRC